MRKSVNKPLSSPLMSNMQEQAFCKLVYKSINKTHFFPRPSCKLRLPFYRNKTTTRPINILVRYLQVILQLSVPHSPLTGAFASRIVKTMEAFVSFK